MKIYDLHNTSNRLFVMTFPTFARVTALETFCFTGVINVEPKSMLKRFSIDPTNENSCAICLKPLLGDEDGLQPDPPPQCTQITSCLHIFHSDCLQIWSREHTTCPLCRMLFKSGAI